MSTLTFNDMQIENEIILNIEHEQGQCIKVVALDGDSLQTLKLLAYSQQHCSLSGYDFTFNNELIADQTNSLKELNLKNGDTLRIQPKPRLTAESSISTLPSTTHFNFNLPQTIENNIHSQEFSFFSDSIEGSSPRDSEEIANDGLDFENLSLDRGFSFAPKLTRQYFANCY